MKLKSLIYYIFIVAISSLDAQFARVAQRIPRQAGQVRTLIIPARAVEAPIPARTTKKPFWTSGRKLAAGYLAGSGLVATSVARNYKQSHPVSNTVSIALAPPPLNPEEPIKGYEYNKISDKSGSLPTLEKDTAAQEPCTISSAVTIPPEAKKRIEDLEEEVAQLRKLEKKVNNSMHAEEQRPVDSTIENEPKISMWHKILRFMQEKWHQLNQQGITREQRLEERRRSPYIYGRPKMDGEEAGEPLE